MVVKKTEKDCKHCCQSIPVDANKCYHCSEWQDRIAPTEPSLPQNLWSLATSDVKQIGKALGFLAGVVVIILIGGYFGIKIFTSSLPAGSSVSMTKEGAFIFTSQGEKKAVFLLNPNGTTKSPWISTGITVNKGDEITINASGAVSLNIQHTVDAARSDKRPVSPWSGPEGLSGKWIGKRPLDERRVKNVFFPNVDFGKLVAQIAPKSSIPPLRSDNMKEIGKEGKITALQDGVLYLTVNEVLLTTTDTDSEEYKKSKAAYAPDELEGNELYYIERKFGEEYIDAQMGKVVALLKAEDAQTHKGQAAIEKLRERKGTPEVDIILEGLKNDAEKGKDIQDKRWKYIDDEDYENIWYDDNSGSFSVTILMK